MDAKPVPLPSGTVAFPFGPAELPRVFWAARRSRPHVVPDPAARTTEALSTLDLDRRVRPGATVAVGVGSRGIGDIQSVVRATVAHLRHLGLDPFVVPAMGSHGAGDADGQEAVLAGYGITERGVGCPVRSTLDVVELGRCRPTDRGDAFPVHMDRLAAAADHVVVVNRVKPHTIFDGDVESGLAKMLIIGLGNRVGASTIHRAVIDHGWPAVVQAATDLVTGRVDVLAGVAIVEDDADRTARIEAMTGPSVLDLEPGLLADARARLPRLPFDEVDIVLVDRIGKDISGSGWDVNVLGRKGSLHRADPERRPRVHTVVIRGLTPATKGNALGVGLAELCRSRVVDGMDRDATWVNAETSGNIAAAMVPVHHPTDLALLQGCAGRTGLRGLSRARLVWIRDTLDLTVVACSEALLPEAVGRDDLDILTGLRPLPVDADGNLPDLLPRPGDPAWALIAP